MCIQIVKLSEGYKIYLLVSYFERPNLLYCFMVYYMYWNISSVLSHINSLFYLLLVNEEPVIRKEEKMTYRKPHRRWERLQTPNLLNLIKQCQHVLSDKENATLSSLYSCLKRILTPTKVFYDVFIKLVVLLVDSNGDEETLIGSIIEKTTCHRAPPKTHAGTCRKLEKKQKIPKAPKQNQCRCVLENWCYLMHWN